MESYYARKPPLSPASAASAAASPRALQQLESEFGPDVARRVHLTRAFTQLRDELAEAVRLAKELAADAMAEMPFLRLRVTV